MTRVNCPSYVPVRKSEKKMCERREGEKLTKTVNYFSLMSQWDKARNASIALFPNPTISLKKIEVIINIY